jgi:hypothetical protein
VSTVSVDSSPMADSGTPPIVVGLASVSAIKGLLNPARAYSRLYLTDFVDCYATAPPLGVISSGLC